MTSIQNQRTAIVNALLLGLDPNSLITTPQTQVRANFAGFEGDKHAGLTRLSDSRTPHYPRGTEIRNDRQVSIVSSEELQIIAARMSLPELRPDWLGANLMVSGIPNLSQIPPGAHLYFSGGVTLVITAENRPCKHPGKVLQTVFPQVDYPELFPKAALQLRGLVACVEKPGLIQLGEQIRLEVPRQVIYSPEPSES